MEQIKEEIARVECRRVSPKAAVYGSEMVRGSKQVDVQAEAQACLDRLTEKYNRMLISTANLQAMFEAAISGMDWFTRKVLRSYFIHTLTWEQVCVQEDKSYRHIMRIWRAAKEIFECHCNVT